jgi:hypothetical protein
MQVGLSKNTTSSQHGEAEDGMFRTWDECSVIDSINNSPKFCSKHSRVSAWASLRTVAAGTQVTNVDRFLKPVPAGLGRADCVLPGSGIHGVGWTLNRVT